MIPERCRVCAADTLTFLWWTCGQGWWRCARCGSDSSSTDYADVVGNYGASYLIEPGRNPSGVPLTRDVVEGTMRSNFAAFAKWEHLAPDRTFLDVGCCEGAAMQGMQRAGWAVHGFDVIEAVREFGSCVTVAPAFRASLFPRQYGAVLCREVLEHVPDWRGLLREMHAALLPGGLLQLQTPRPWHRVHPMPYQREHLQLLAPEALRGALVEIGFTVLESDLWDMGQRWLVRKAT